MGSMFSGMWFDGINKLTSPSEWLSLVAILGFAIFIGYMGTKSLGNPLRFVKTNRWLLLVVLAVIFFGVSSLMKADDLKKPGVTPYGIVSFELAKDGGTAKDILDKWGGDSINVARYQTWMDFLFILSYTVLLGFICFWIAEAGKGALSFAGMIVGWMMPVAGLFDVIENIALLWMLNAGAGADDLPARIAYWMALPKFIIILYLVSLLAMAFVLLYVSGLPSRLRQGIRQ